MKKGGHSQQQREGEEAQQMDRCIAIVTIVGKNTNEKRGGCCMYGKVLKLVQLNVDWDAWLDP